MYESNDVVIGLLKRIADGDEAAMQRLYEMFDRRIYAFCLNRLKDQSQAEEVVVDTLYEVWKHPMRFRGESKFSTWLIGIARHKLLNQLRARGPQHAEIDEEMPSDEADPSDIVAQSQRRESVLECMEKLPTEQRECMHLVFYEGYALLEVAEIQQCPENTVKTRLFHARQKIKNCLRLVLEKEDEYARG